MLAHLPDGTVTFDPLVSSPDSVRGAIVTLAVIRSQRGGSVSAVDAIGHSNADRQTRSPCLAISGG